MKAKRRGHTPLSGRRLAVLVLAALAAAALLLAGLYALGRHIENSAYQEERQQMSADFGQLPSVEYQGRVYVKRPEVTTLLLIGVDKASDEETDGYRDGGQADFLLYVAIDHKNRRVSSLQLERDTVTDVPVVGVLGNDAGSRRMQICLAHAYGKTEADRCRHTAQAVANLLEGESPEMVFSIPLDAVSILNHTLGGVTVTIPEDLSQLDSAMTPGAVITLSDSQAETLVRARMGVGDGTNFSRMARQRCFMDAAAASVRARLSREAEFAGTLYDTLSAVQGYTNAQRGRIINELNRVAVYDVLPAETLAGEYSVGSDGFVEFYASEDAAAQWLLKVLYEPK